MEILVTHGHTSNLGVISESHYVKDTATALLESLGALSVCDNLVPLNCNELVPLK